jgi:hypothetical protein
MEIRVCVRPRGVATRTAMPVRQVLGAIAQFEKATTVAKLKAARDRKIAAGEKCGGRKSYAEARPEMVELARQLRRPDPDRRPVSLRKVAAALAERGYVASTGKPYEVAAVASMLDIRACLRPIFALRRMRPSFPSRRWPYRTRLPQHARQRLIAPAERVHQRGANVKNDERGKQASQYDM